MTHKIAQLDLRRSQDHLQPVNHVPEHPQGGSEKWVTIFSPSPAWEREGGGGLRGRTWRRINVSGGADDEAADGAVGDREAGDVDPPADLAVADGGIEDARGQRPLLAVEVVNDDGHRQPLPIVPGGDGVSGGAQPVEAEMSADREVDLSDRSDRSLARLRRLDDIARRSQWFEGSHSRRGIVGDALGDE